MNGLVVVTGATGTVGRLVVDELAGRGAPVRAVSRRPPTAGPPGVEVARLSLADPATWGEAFAALGRPVRYTRPGLARYWVHARRTGMAPGVAAATSVLYSLARVGVGSRVTDDVARVLGRPAGDVARFVEDYRGVWAR